MTRRGNNVVYVIIDKLTKSAHFLPTKITFSLVRFAKLDVNEIISRHRVLISIMLDRDLKFTFRF